MSYINNHKAAYEKLQSIKDVDAQHISLYHAFFYQFNKFGWPEHLLIPRDNLMFMAKIGSTNTFYKKVRQLHDWGFIKYTPSKNPLVGSRYTYIKCDTSTDTSTDTSGGISTDTSTDTSSETLIRPKDYKTKRPKEVQYQFIDLWSKYDLGSRSKGSKKQAKEFWGKLSEEDKINAVEMLGAYLRQSGKDQNGNSYGRQAKYYLRDKEWEGVNLDTAKLDISNIPEEEQKIIDTAKKYCDDWGISKEVGCYIHKETGKTEWAVGGITFHWLKQLVKEWPDYVKGYEKEYLWRNWKDHWWDAAVRNSNEFISKSEKI